MAASKPKYTVDTCSLTAVRRVYPEDVFPGVWAKLNELADEGVFFCVQDVMRELEFEDDEITAWAKAHKSIFLPLDEEIQSKAAEIIASHQTLIDLKKRRSSADPFIIASALVSSCIVVTEEKPSGGPDKEKMPDVCRAYQVEWISMLEMFRREGLRL